MENINNGETNADYLFPTTKDNVLEMLDTLKKSVMEMEDFTEFHEGADGVILYALLKQSSHKCPDVGDFNYIYQGYQSVLEATFKTIKDDVFDRQKFGRS